MVTAALRPRPHIRLSPARAAFVGVLILDLLVTAFVAQQIVRLRDYPFDADEAIHANSGLSLALDLQAGDFGAFFSDFYRQGFYPPAFAPLKALAFLIFGASPLVARLFSLACLFAAALVIYAAGLKLDRERGWLIGLGAVGLTLTGQFTLVTSALVLMEAPGLLISFSLLWAYLHALEQPRAARLALVSLLLLGTFLTKYTYGLVAVATIVAMEVFSIRRLWQAETRRPARRIARRWLGLFGPFVLALIIWFAGPNKITDFINYATAQPQQAWLTLENLIFYPRSIAFHYAPSSLFALVTLAGVVWAATRWRDERLRLLLVYFAIGMLEMAINLPKNPRFIATFVPAAHVLTGALLAWLAAHWRTGWARARTGVIAIGVALAVCLASAAPALAERFAALPALMQASVETEPRVNELAGWIAAQVPATERFFLINPWDQFSEPALVWYLATQRPLRFTLPFLPWVHLEPITAESVEALKNNMRANGATYVVALEGGPYGAPIWWEYANALGAELIPIAQQDFIFEQYDVAGWVKQALLTVDGLERAMADGRYTLHIRALVYRLAQP
ncbi:MAG TPA: glycosyltransferase family 39 protein [Anaerolineae bacterium]|nr:glycosyltransferase family 39 protein [Anaerolineae bacterium]